MYKILVVYQDNVSGMERCFEEYKGDYFYKTLAEAHAIGLRNSLKNDGIDGLVQVYVVDSE